jgi:hypothetical protein
MKPLTLMFGAALLLASATSSLGAGHAGMAGGGMAGSTLRPATAQTMTGPTNPNTRSGNALGHKGAPNGASCQAIGVYPGNAANSPGSPFNEPTATSPGGNAGQHYAGNAPQNSKNTASVSQYDNACANQVK